MLDLLPTCGKDSTQPSLHQQINFSLDGQNKSGESCFGNSLAMCTIPKIIACVRASSKVELAKNVSPTSHLMTSSAIMGKNAAKFTCVNYYFSIKKQNFQKISALH